jgi:hypothetical protein
MKKNLIEKDKANVNREKARENILQAALNPVTSPAAKKPQAQADWEQEVHP